MSDFDEMSDAGTAFRFTERKLMTSTFNGGL